MWADQAAIGHCIMWQLQAPSPHVSELIGSSLRQQQAGRNYFFPDIKVLDPIQCKVAKQLWAINPQLLLSGVVFINSGPKRGLAVSEDINTHKQCLQPCRHMPSSFVGHLPRAGALGPPTKSAFEPNPFSVWRWLTQSQRPIGSPAGTPSGPRCRGAVPGSSRATSCCWDTVCVGVGGTASVGTCLLVLLPCSVEEEECTRHPMAEVPLILGCCPRVTR